LRGSKQNSINKHKSFTKFEQRVNKQHNNPTVAGKHQPNFTQKTINVKTKLELTKGKATINVRPSLNSSRCQRPSLTPRDAALQDLHGCGLLPMPCRSRTQRTLPLAVSLTHGLTCRVTYIWIVLNCSVM
jgi:hypothetical protein